MTPAACIIVIGFISAMGACTTSMRAVDPPINQVLFVCEHGNAKSLMAASYFNDLAQARGLPFRGVSRGSAPDFDTVPGFIQDKLPMEGFDISGFRPKAVSADDIAASVLVVTIGTALPADASGNAPELEQWNDVPPASTDYVQSRASLKAHVADLLKRLEGGSRR